MNLVFHSLLLHSCWSVNVAPCERGKKPMLPAVTRLSPAETLDWHERTGTVPIAMTFVISEGGMADRKLFQGMISLRVNSEPTAKPLEWAMCSNVLSRRAHSFFASLSIWFTNSTLETFSCANTDQCFREHRQVKTWKRNSLFKYLD